MNIDINMVWFGLVPLVVVYCWFGGGVGYAVVLMVADPLDGLN